MNVSCTSIVLRLTSLIAGMTLLASITGCEQPTEVPHERVAARVDGVVISEAELNRAMSRLGKLSEAESVRARAKLLEALINQKLVSNTALAAQLDRDPAVALALQQAQRQVLVEAYAEHLMKGMGKPQESEISDYYGQHPELFASRKAYRFHELSLNMTSKRVPEVEAKLKQSQNLAEFSEWLKTEGIESKAAVAVKPAEQIPAGILTYLKTMEDGHVAVLPAGPEHIKVLQLQASQPQPVTLEQARRAIEQALLTKQRKSLLDAEINKMRSSGKIEYASGFTPALPSHQSADSLK